jgi:hypothetical protein
MQNPADDRFIDRPQVAMMKAGPDFLHIPFRR